MATKGDMQELNGFAQLSQVEAALEVDDVPTPIAAYSRGKKLSVAVLGVAAVIFGTALAAKHFGTEGSKFVDYVPFSHPKFVNYVATAVHPDFALFPRQCDPAIVLDVCKRLNEETVEFYNSAMDTNVNYVHALEIAQAFSVGKSSVVDLFHSLDLTNQGDVLLHPNAFAVSCQELCEALVGSFPEKDLPGRSDVGCYKSPLTQKVRCDQDVSEAAIQKIPFKLHSAEEKGDFLESGALKQFTKGAEGSHQKSADKALGDEMSPSAAEFTKVEALTYPKIPVHVLKVTVINLFRIYPKLESSVLAETGMSNFLGQSDEPNIERRLISNSDTCASANDGGCDEPRYCVKGTDCTDCNTCHIDPSEGWKETTLQLAVKAKAYVSTALKNMNGRQIPNVVTKWFGNNFDYPTRQEIKRILVGIDEMLGNVDYVYPGEMCQANTYAYVYPRPDQYAKNAKGEYIFHLCDVYMRAGEGEKIETLTHEGSHHVTMQTDDSKYNGQTMYGRPLCETVAKACAAGDQASCTSARSNADTYCYFINDAALAHDRAQFAKGDTAPKTLNEALQSGQAAPGGIAIGGGAGGVMASLR